LTIFSLLLIAIPLSYYALYSFAVKKKSQRASLGPDDNFAPYVSIIIPTYNEIKTIERRVKNLDGIRYPAGSFEAIFVDGASTDGTPDLIEELGAKGRPFLRVVRQPSRQGYNSAIYEGICQAKSDIVVTGEASSFFHPSAVSAVVRHLAASSIGVATGKSELYNPDESLATRLEAAYRTSHDQLRFAESKIDSTPDMKGELLAFRKELGLRLKPRETLPDNASFDMSISYMSRSLGFRAIFDPEAVFYEYAPTNLKERFIVQIRRGTAFTGALWNFRSMIFNPKFGSFGLLIAPSRFLMLIAFPWMLLSAPFVLLFESLSNPYLGLLVCALTGMGLVYRRTRYVIVSFALSQLVLAAATLRLLFRRHTQFIDAVPTARR
jgi:cellulose synthase/poly-beta-1,6-N-acetylglucosamine synthase-like glycosyltransferase